MTVADLRKLLKERNVEGYSKLTTKPVIVRVLEAHDTDPSTVPALVEELGVKKPSPKKTDTSTEGSEPKTEDKPKRTRKPKKTSSEEEKSSEPSEELKEHSKEGEEPKEEKEPKEGKPKKTRKPKASAEEEKSESSEDKPKRTRKTKKEAESFTPITELVKSKDVNPSESSEESDKKEKPKRKSRSTKKSEDLEEEVKPKVKEQVVQKIATEVKPKTKKQVKEDKKEVIDSEATQPMNEEEIAEKRAEVRAHNKSEETKSEEPKSGESKSEEQIELEDLISSLTDTLEKIKLDQNNKKQIKSWMKELSKVQNSLNYHLGMDGISLEEDDL